MSSADQNLPRDNRDAHDDDKKEEPLVPLDFGAAKESELARRAPGVELEKVRWHQFTRNTLALGLALLLAILTTATLAAGIAGTDIETLTRISQLTITPVVALCGTAFGFYFAQEAARRQP